GVKHAVWDEQALFRQPADLEADVVVAPVADAVGAGFHPLRAVASHHTEIELDQAIVVLVVAEVDAADAGIAVDQQSRLGIAQAHTRCPFSTAERSSGRWYLHRGEERAGGVLCIRSL